MALIYKILPRSLWNEAQKKGRFEGAAVDIADGYIHFSTSGQVRETAAKHFAGQADLLLLACEAGSFGDKLKWEVSRGGDLFPHLYGALDVSAVSGVKELPLGGDDLHVFPDLGE